MDVSGRMLWLLLGLVTDISIFILYRVAGSPIFSISAIPGFADFLIPLGFVFYTLQAISYLVDINRGKISAESDPVDFFLYLIFFPKILAGPIERAGTFLPQVKNVRIVDNAKLERGFILVLLGLFRKIAIAEVLLTIMPEYLFPVVVQNNGSLIGLFPTSILTYSKLVPYSDRLMGVLAYGIYLYNDFAGYTTIMRGVSLLLGFELTPNFRYPYFALTLSDFWSRWHISLSSWLRDYVYFPLTRLLRRKPVGRTLLVPVVIPLVTTMLAAGFWHGLTYPFLLWGMVYGILLSLEQMIFQFIPSLRPQSRSLLFKIMCIVLTFCSVNLLWVPFAVNSLDGVLSFWGSVFSGTGLHLASAFSPWILVLVFVSFLLDFIESHHQEQTILLHWPLPLRGLVLSTIFIILFLAFTWTSPYTSNVFIYQSF